MIQILDVGFIFFTLLFASFLQAITSFGFALMAVPLLMLIMSPKEAIILTLIAGTIQKSMMIQRTWHEGSFRAIAPLFLASIIGALSGGYTLRLINDSALKIFIGVVLLLATLLMAANVSITFRRRRLAQSMIGIISGFLGSTTSFSGPPVMLYMLNENQPKETIRANLARYFVLGNIASLASFCLFGTFQTISLFSLLVSIPALFIGIWLGDKLFHSLDAAVFRRLALCVISGSGLLSIGSGLLPYLPTLAKMADRL